LLKEEDVKNGKAGLGGSVDGPVAPQSSKEVWKLQAPSKNEEVYDQVARQ